MLIFLPDDLPFRNLCLFFRTVKFWDLETFQLVSSTDPETGGVRWVNCFIWQPIKRRCWNFAW